MAELDEFLWTCVAEIDRRAALATDRGEIVREGASVFRTAIEKAVPVEAECTTVAALAHVPADSPVRNIPWVSSPRIEQNDGAEVVLGLVNRVRDLGQVTCGLMLLAPGAAYPEHSHPPHEIYLPLSGDGNWMYGGANDYRRLGPDDLVYNPPSGRHGAVAGDEALLALYVLWG